MNTDIVYLFKESTKNNSEELRYSLRSLANIPHRHVYIVGEVPNWVKSVHHIPVAQSGTKNENVGKNLAAAVDHPGISDDFILMNDDFFIMKEIRELPVLNFGLMVDVISEYGVRYPETTSYIENMKSLYNYFVSLGVARPLSYELHVPMMFNKANMIQLRRETGDQRWFQMRSFYGNHFKLGGLAIRDSKVFLDQIHNDKLYIRDPEQYLDNQMFLSGTGGSFANGRLGSFVREQFHQKSYYEI